MMDRKKDKYSLINFEETELRLGLPGGNKSKEINNNGNIIIINDEETNLMINSGNGKRGFSETTHNVDLKLNLSSSSNDDDKEVLGVTQVILENKEKNVHSVKPSPSKAQVVGWPPVRSCRKNIMAVQKNNKDDDHEVDKKTATCPANFVKVSMDGAPYLRKVDLKLYKSYQELSHALGKMFSSFTIGNCSSQRITKDFMIERKLIDILNGSEYVATYEDKDGDWMLVGDVPWKMFVESCKRLQIMKGSEAIGLAPRAVEKCKNRT